jgi:hypothetical protein
MRTLTDLLLNYPIPGVQSLERRRICAEEASALMGCEFTSKQMQYKNEELLFSVSPLIKSALFLKQNELIERLAARGIIVRFIK